MNQSFSNQIMSEADQIREHGRVIARGMQDVKVEQQKNMATAEKRRATMLERAAEKLLSGKL
jgi:hypothetical protein